VVAREVSKAAALVDGDVDQRRARLHLLQLRREISLGAAAPGISTAPITMSACGQFDRPMPPALDILRDQLPPKTSSR
jgi:hypothetical protein